jgi:hypothetical protein
MASQKKKKKREMGSVILVEIVPHPASTPSNGTLCISMGSLLFKPFKA